MCPVGTIACSHLLLPSLAFAALGEGLELRSMRGRDGVGVSLPGLEPLMIKRLNLTELGPGPEVFKKEMAPIL